MIRLLPLALAAVVSGQAVASDDGSPGPLRIRVTPALSACGGALRDAFGEVSHAPVALDVDEASGVAGADLLIADSAELTRILEGGLADERTAVVLGDVAWVTVSPPEQPAPSSLAAFIAAAPSRVAILGGAAGREARATIGLPPTRLAVSRDAAELRSARHALLPRSLAGPGRQVVVDGLSPLTVVAAPVIGSPHPAEVRSFLQFLGGRAARRAFEACGGEPQASATRLRSDAGYAQAVMDWWVPACSLAHNAYNHPVQVLGPPDAMNTGGKDEYTGMMSLGQGGWVVVDMGRPVVDHPGADVRVYQTTSSEPVTLYASDSPSGPFRLVQLMRTCGIPSPGVFSNHCDFDLANAGIASARYLRVEDGEIYPCLAGTTVTEGADIDAIAALAP
jgi:hypothetical protein